MHKLFMSQMDHPYMDHSKFWQTLHKVWVKSSQIISEKVLSVWSMDEIVVYLVDCRFIKMMDMSVSSQKYFH